MSYLANHSMSVKVVTGTGESTSPVVARWYLVQCKPKQELRALEHLRNQHIACYCPMHSVEQLSNGRINTRQQPLFPGYLFVNLCELGSNWYCIRSTRGVRRLVTFADRPLFVADEIINDLQCRLSRVGDRPLFEAGSRVMIADGPFKDLDGIYCSPDGTKRAIILLELLHRQQQVSVPLRILRA